MAKPTRIRSLRRPHAEASVDLRQRRAWFDEQPPQTGEPPKTPDTAPGQQSGQQPATFTQEQLNQILGERLKRAEEGWTKKFLTDLGVENAESLTNLVKAEKQRAEGEKTEIQKIQERVAAAEKKAAEAEARAAKAEEDRLIERRDQEIKAALRTARTNKPDSVLILMERSNPELVKAVMKEGAVDGEALNKLVEAAKKAHAEMFVGSGPGSPSNGGGNVPEPTKAKKEQARLEQNQRLRRRF